jgi:hypothetical protein
MDSSQFTDERSIKKNETSRHMASESNGGTYAMILEEFTPLSLIQRFKASMPVPEWPFLASKTRTSERH